MPNEITQQNSESSSGNAAASADTNQAITIKTAAILCAAGLLICFFLPWINLLLARPSGFNFAMEGGSAMVLWSIPFLCVFTILAGLTNSGLKTIAVIAGLVPFCFLGYALSQNGSGLLQVFEIGAYAELTFALGLIVLGCRLK